jgi:hypothetical protein
MVFVTIVTVLLVLVRLAPLWGVVLVMIGGILTTTCIGAFQLRHDRRLSERGFLQLMTTAIGRLPRLVLSRAGDGLGASGRDS